MTIKKNQELNHQTEDEREDRWCINDRKTSKIINKEEKDFNDIDDSVTKIILTAEK